MPLGFLMRPQLNGDTFGFDRDASHSWLCNSLHIAAAERLGVQLGKFGLLDSKQAAREAVGLFASTAPCASVVKYHAGGLAYRFVRVV
jgi:hypothetical protein